MSDLDDPQMGELMRTPHGERWTKPSLWEGPFGDAYTARNRVDWRARLPFWGRIVRATAARVALEVGCNAGWNLLCLRELGVRGSGVEVNAEAAKEARGHGFFVWEADAAVCYLLADAADLVFTAGVLIHIPPADLDRAMRSIAHASRRWVLAVEYDAEEEVEVEYRGQRGALWKRPFGRLYQALGLRLVEEGDAEGFDRCRFWLMEKP